ERVPAQRLQRMDRGEPGPVRAHPAHAADDHRALAVRTSVMRKTTRRNDEGIALVFTLFLMASLSALAISLMFLSQTETSSTRNYRTMSQARYAGEAGAHKAINYMINSYTQPSSFANYNLTVSPVTCNNASTS